MIKTFITVKGKSERCPGKNIKLMIKEGKIKYLEIENHDKDIHNG